MLTFDTPSLQNQCFCVPMEVKMEVKCGLKSIFIAIENDDRKARLFREGVGDISRRLGEDFGLQQRRGFRGGEASGTELDLR